MLVPLYNGDIQESNMGENLIEVWNTYTYGTKVCSTCAESKRENKLPSSHVLCQTHALHAISPELTDLKVLEERLGAMHIPFMQTVDLACNNK